jgi:hypothetical protein
LHRFLRRSVAFIESTLVSESSTASPRIVGARNIRSRKPSSKPADCDPLEVVAESGRLTRTDEHLGSPAADRRQRFRAIPHHRLLVAACPQIRD